MSVLGSLGNMGFVGLAVMAFLVALSIYSVSVIVEKTRRFRAASRESAAFVQEFGRCLREANLTEAAASARRHERSPVAQVVSAGVDELIGQSGAGIDPPARVDLVSRALERSTALALTDLKRGLGGLATVGSTAPFIGLFGTVIGIVHAFEGIAAAGSGGVAGVSGGIAEALVATALGILVAIPAVMAFNHFTGMLERFHVEMSTSGAELVDFIIRRAQVAHASH
jgi:biopolymer transport protein ExbB/biopolymer transport protein TolQ